MLDPIQATRDAAEVAAESLLEQLGYTPRPGEAMRLVDAVVITFLRALPLEERGAVDKTWWVRDLAAALAAEREGEAA